MSHHSTSALPDTQKGQETLEPDSLPSAKSMCRPICRAGSPSWMIQIENTACLSCAARALTTARAAPSGRLLVFGHNLLPGCGSACPATCRQIQHFTNPHLLFHHKIISGQACECYGVLPYQCGRHVIGISNSRKSAST